MSTAIMSPAEFMKAVPAMPNSNTAFGMRYADELRDIIIRQANRQPRSVQRSLGPSELGQPCHRQVIGKMAGEPRTNNVADPWPSIVGTAVHAWLAEKFDLENKLNGYPRWVPEQRVFPTPDHPGTADLYDGIEQSVVDWKCLAESTLSKIRSPAGPPRHYVVQLLLYGLGYRNLGLPVKRVVLCALPRTASSLSGMYVWDHPWTPADDALLDQVIAETAVRREAARLILSGQLAIEDIPITPGSDSCYFCSFYRPQTARDGGPGCPGHSIRE